jgi:hypothetical protein
MSKRLRSCATATGCLLLFWLATEREAQAANNNVGWALADCASCTTAYTPLAAYSHNSAGGAITIVREETGFYDVSFDLLYTGAPDDVQATAYFTNGTCDAVSKGHSGTTVIVRVACYDANGNDADRKFTLLYQSRDTNMGTASKGLAFLDASQFTTASYTPATQYNSTGASNTMVRNSTGNYTATLPGLTATGGDVQVTALNPDTGTNRCKAVNWSAASTGTTVNVHCYDQTGAFDDTPFTLAYALDLPFGRAAPAATSEGAYALASNDTNTSVYTPSKSYNFSNFGTGYLKAQKTATGQYTVSVPGSLSYTSSLVLVTAEGGGSDYCNVESWNNTTNQIFVDCYAQGGAAVDSKFDVAFQTGS